MESQAEESEFHQFQVAQLEHTSFPNCRVIREMNHNRKKRGLPRFSA